MTPTKLDFLFWAAGFCGHAVLLSILLLRRHAKSFPVFTALIASRILQTAILYTIHRLNTGEVYFWTYWSFQFTDICLQLGVLYEIARTIFKPLNVWSPDIRLSLTLLTLGSLGIAAALTYLASPPTQQLVQSIYLKGNFFAAVLMSELFVVTASLSTRAGLAFKSHVRCLSEGLVTYSITMLTVETADTYVGLRVQSGYHLFMTLQHFRIAIYLCCLAYWIISFLRPEYPLRPVTPEMHARLLHLRAEVKYHVPLFQREKQ
jgi:hypothetical protein